MISRHRLKVNNMKIALIGYGRMGRLIEQKALNRGHQIVCIIDKDNLDDFSSEAFRSADVAIEFTTPQTAEENIRKAWASGVNVVSGTTGWQNRLPELKQELLTNGKALFWSSNYSIGVNLFFALSKRMSELMQPYKDYSALITEIHHIHKLDAPSGTAVTLAELTGIQAKEIKSIRQGEVPGTHILTYESDVDKLDLRHEAKSREGFAVGAVLAAEYLNGKRGFYTMNDLLKIQ